MGGSGSKSREERSELGNASHSLSELRRYFRSKAFHKLVKALFMKYDVDQDHSISEEELFMACVELFESFCQLDPSPPGNVYPNREEIHRMFSFLDEDQSGNLCESEFSCVIQLVYQNAFFPENVSVQSTTATDVLSPRPVDSSSPPSVEPISTDEQHVSARSERLSSISSPENASNDSPVPVFSSEEVETIDREAVGEEHTQDPFQRETSDSAPLLEPLSSSPIAIESNDPHYGMERQTSELETIESESVMYTQPQEITSFDQCPTASSSLPSSDILGTSCGVTSHDISSSVATSPSLCDQNVRDTAVEIDRKDMLNADVSTLAISTSHSVEQDGKSSHVESRNDVNMYPHTVSDETIRRNQSTPSLVAISSPLAIEQRDNIIPKSTLSPSSEATSVEIVDGVESSLQDKYTSSFPVHQTTVTDPIVRDRPTHELVTTDTLASALPTASSHALNSSVSVPSSPTECDISIAGSSGAVFVPSPVLSIYPESPVLKSPTSRLLSVEDEDKDRSSISTEFPAAVSSAKESDRAICTISSSSEVSSTDSHPNLDARPILLLSPEIEITSQSQSPPRLGDHADLNLIQRSLDDSCLNVERVSSRPFTPSSESVSDTGYLLEDESFSTSPFSISQPSSHGRSELASIENDRDPELASSRESFVVSGPVLFSVSSTLSDRESSSRTNSFSEPRKQPVDFSSSDTVSPPVKANGEPLNLRDSVPHASEHLVSLPDVSTVDSVSSMYPPFFSPPTIPFGIGSGRHNPVHMQEESGIGSYLPTGEHILQSMRHHGHSDSFSSHRSLEEIAYGDEDDYSYSQSHDEELDENIEPSSEYEFSSNQYDKFDSYDRSIVNHSHSTNHENYPRFSQRSFEDDQHHIYFSQGPVNDIYDHEHDHYDSPLYSYDDQREYEMGGQFIYLNNEDEHDYESGYSRVGRTLYDKEGFPHDIKDPRSISVEYGPHPSYSNSVVAESRLDAYGTVGHDVRIDSFTLRHGYGQRHPHHSSTQALSPPYAPFPTSLVYHSQPVSHSPFHHVPRILPSRSEVAEYPSYSSPPLPIAPPENEFEKRLEDALLRFRQRQLESNPAAVPVTEFDLHVSRSHPSLVSTQSSPKSSDLSPEQSKKSPPDQSSVRKAKIQSGLRFANESEQEAARKRDQRRRALEYADKVQRTRREKHSVSNRHPSDLPDSDSRLNSRTSPTDVPSCFPETVGNRKSNPRPPVTDEHETICSDLNSNAPRIAWENSDVSSSSPPSPPRNSYLARFSRQRRRQEDLDEMQKKIDEERQVLMKRIIDSKHSHSSMNTKKSASASSPLDFDEKTVERKPSAVDAPPPKSLSARKQDPKLPDQPNSLPSSEKRFSVGKKTHASPTATSSAPRLLRNDRRGQDAKNTGFSGSPVRISSPMSRNRRQGLVTHEQGEESSSSFELSSSDAFPLDHRVKKSIHTSSPEMGQNVSSRSFDHSTVRVTIDHAEEQIARAQRTLDRSIALDAAFSHHVRSRESLE